MVSQEARRNTHKQCEPYPQFPQNPVVAPRISLGATCPNGVSIESPVPTSWRETHTYYSTHVHSLSESRKNKLVVTSSMYVLATVWSSSDLTRSEGAKLTNLCQASLLSFN